MPRFACLPALFFCYSCAAPQAVHSPRETAPKRVPDRELSPVDSIEPSNPHLPFPWIHIQAEDTNTAVADESDYLLDCDSEDWLCHMAALSDELAAICRELMTEKPAQLHIRLARVREEILRLKDAIPDTRMQRALWDLRGRADDLADALKRFR